MTMEATTPLEHVKQIRAEEAERRKAERRECVGLILRPDVSKEEGRRLSELMIKLGITNERAKALQDGQQKRRRYEQLVEAGNESVGRQREQCARAQAAAVDNVADVACQAFLALADCVKKGVVRFDLALCNAVRFSVQNMQSSAFNTSSYTSALDDYQNRFYLAEQELKNAQQDHSANGNALADLRWELPELFDDARDASVAVSEATATGAVGTARVG